MMAAMIGINIVLKENVGTPREHVAQRFDNALEALAALTKRLVADEFINLALYVEGGGGRSEWTEADQAALDRKTGRTAGQGEAGLHSTSTSPRCSCWYQAGGRRGWTDDDPCAAHPEERNPRVVRERGALMHHPRCLDPKSQGPEPHGH